LTSDETSVNPTLITSGLAGLPQILNTRQNFHSALLREGIRAILGRSLKSSFSPVTREYLMRLYGGLASLSTVKRVAYLVSFEAHAERMINALWERIVETFPVEKDKPVYFRIHVGGDDPAEAYHVAMTGSMITRTIRQDQIGQFRADLLEANRINVDWCRAICSDHPFTA
jgi:hypothetical protein